MQCISGMELHKLQILHWNTGACCHSVAITSACVSTSAREVGSTVASSGNNGLIGLHSVDSAISHVVGHDSFALVTIHQQIHGEVLHEEDAIVAECPSKESVQHAVARSVGHSAASVGLAALAKVLAGFGSMV